MRLKQSIILFSWLFCAISLSVSGAAGQIQVIESTGDLAVINIGSTDGVQENDLFRIIRSQGTGGQEIATAKAMYVLPKMTRIKVIERVDNMTVLKGDRAERITEVSIQPPKENESNQNQVVQSQQYNPMSRTIKGVYLGPTAGVFVPQGAMKDVFQTNFGYGGILGLQFKQDLDVSIRFFFTSKSMEWSFWSVQLLGRRYFADKYLLDIGYGISYHKIADAGLGSGDINLGFVGGFGYSFPVALSTWFEFGFLYHYYPNFGDQSGQFLTVQGRLIL